MGMQIGDSSVVSPLQTSGAANWQERRQSFQQLTSALQSGDINSAKQAFSALSNGSSAKEGGPLAQIGQALQSGDLTAAQQAMQTLQAGRGRHHHHHHHPDSSSAGAPTTPSSAGEPAVGSLVNAVA